MKRLFLCLVLLLAAGTAGAHKPHSGEVRNLIYLIGDGMGLAQVSMLMLEEEYRPTPFDRAQNVALITTYSNNNRVTDSAAAGTALATGHKTNNSMLGVAPDGKPYESMMIKAQRQGMGTGIAVSCYLYHATPGAFYAHLNFRRDFDDAAQQLLDSNIDVLFGGGSKLLSQPCNNTGSYLDAFARKGYRVIDNLADADPKAGGQVLGVFAEKHLPPADKRGDYLPEATATALDLLAVNAAQNDKGFILMVEGSLIDYAGHANDPKWLLGEMRDFSRCVKIAMDFADKNPGTLVVVLADHETGGLSIPSNDADFEQSESGVQYKFSTEGHSASLIPVYLYGTGAEQINGILDNTTLARRLMELLKLD